MFVNNQVEGQIMVVSPLTGCKNITLLETIEAEQLIRNWKSRLDIDITDELCGYKEIYLYQCNQTKLKFFVPPDVSGSPRLYESLERYDWYYMPRKWEHDVAIQDMQGNSRILEVGCGAGDFVERLLAEEQMEASGIEISSSAVNSARKLGRHVYLKSVEDMALEHPGKFDVVCSFQVLEHAADPASFIGACIGLLKPGGRLLISVPDNDGFILLDRNNLLNQPPHHVSRWSRSVFESLPKYFPLRLHKILYEPLAPYHLNWYTGLQLNRLPHLRFLTGIVHRFVSKLILPMACQTGWYRFLRGHSIYVCYQKLSGLS